MSTCVAGESYYRARYYDASSGRFISEDPIGFDGGDNFYAYAENNPANLSDPMGLAPGVAPPPVLPPWTAAEEAAYQAFVRGLRGASRLLSNIGTGALIAAYLFSPSSGINAQWASSAEAQFEQQAQKQKCDKEDDDCEIQLENDESVCRVLPDRRARARCWRSARERYQNCKRGVYIPPLVTDPDE